MPPILRALRPSQWIKNAIVLAAYFFARWDPSQQAHASGTEAAVRVVLAAVLFCLISSALYLVNDIQDLSADRAHPVKRLRPLAAGHLGIPTAWFLAGLLLLVGMGGACLLSLPLAGLLGVYVAMQFAYTFALKRVALLDVFVIATGFVLRAIGGALAIDVRISPWLLLCAFLLALFLALCKRRNEKNLFPGAQPTHRMALAAYDDRLLDLLIGIAGTATVVVYSIYTLAPETVERFHTHRLGFTIPFVVFGIFRYLDQVYRCEEGGRPEKVLLTDPVLIVTIVLYAAAALAVFRTA